MPWPTLNDLKLQINLDVTDTSDDILLGTYLLAARDHIAQKLNRNVFDLTSEIPLDALTNLPVDATDLALDTPAGNSIFMASLLLVSHWYENRASTSNLTIKEVPMAFNALLEPHRIINI